MSPTHYQTLGVPRTATDDEIKAAYRQLMKQYHPDFLAGQIAHYQQLGDHAAVAELEQQREHSEERSREVNKAYQILSDARLRRQYDYFVWMTTYEPSFETPRLRPRTRPHQPTPAYKEKITNRRGVQQAAVIFISLSLLINVIVRINHAPQTPSSIRIEPENGETLVAQYRWLVSEAATLDPAVVQLINGLEARGDAFYKLDSFGSAIMTYTDAIQEQPSATLHYKRGLAHLATMQEPFDTASQNAFQDFLSATRLDPNFGEAWLHLGDLAYQRWDQNQVRADGALALTAYQTYVDLMGVAVDAIIKMRVQQLADELD